MAYKKKTKAKAVPTQFDFAEEAQTIAMEILPKYHHGLINAKIGFLFKNKEIMQKGKNVVGTAEKCGAKTKAVSLYQAEDGEEALDFILTFAYPTWKNLTDIQKYAVVDHELSHCQVESNESTGETKTKIISHDVEEFSSIVRRHGLWQGNLEIFGQIAADACIEDDEAPGDDD